MGLRFRKSKKIAPGVKLNIGKKSAGISFGTRGARYTVNSSGRRTASVGIPGTGISYTSSSGGRKRRSTSSPTQPGSTSHHRKKNGSCLVTLLKGMLIFLGVCLVIGLIALAFSFAWIPSIIALIIIPFLKTEHKKKILLFIIILLFGVFSFTFMLGTRNTNKTTNKLEQPMTETESQTELITEKATEIQTEAATQSQTETELQAEIETEISQTKFYYSTDVVNVRNAPSTDSDVIGSLNRSDKVEVTSIDGEWANVIYNETAAYVSAQFLSETVPQTEASERLVWLPESGSKFHGDDDCSGMTPTGQVAVSEAKGMGYEACQKCAKYIN